MNGPPSKPPNYLVAMLDLLSGAFACVVVIFIIFATLMGADMGGARAFMHVEARVSVVSPGSPVVSSILPEIAVRLDPVHEEAPATVYRFDEDGTYPLGLRLATSGGTRSASEGYHRQGISPWPHILGDEIDEAGAPTGSRAHSILFNRARGTYVVSLLLVGSRAAQDAELGLRGDVDLDSQVRFELICTMSAVGGGARQDPVRVVCMKRLGDLITAGNDTESVSARVAFDLLDGRTPDRDCEVVSINPAGLPVLLQMCVRVGDG